MNGWNSNTERRYVRDGRKTQERANQRPIKHGATVTSLSGARKLIYRTSPRGNFVRFRQTPLDATDSAVLA